ncbi:signal peptidase 22 kDa subunit [Hesseltinella vesiculosa]|uniref:Signal peptidase subunit 3 n=1 Tax=Hesseltinella vesiculosa TaxID=101127 RepID=A0A1X2GDN5_9FUNG|nr:signal peptidase 22 kDa subunit [Hesseltinella vesiculosa]
MFNLQNRGNVLFSFLLTCLSGVFGLISLMTFISGYGAPINPKVKVNPDTIRIATRRYGPDSYDYRNSKNEFARLNFNINADLSPMFNWNTKQIFLTVVAEYETKSHDANKIVLWDRIITSKRDAHIKLRNVPNKYAFIDVSRKWSEQPVNITLHWDVTPYVGVLQGGSAGKPLDMIILPSSASMK